MFFKKIFPTKGNDNPDYKATLDNKGINIFNRKRIN